MAIPMRKALGLGLVAVMSTIALGSPAWADDHRDRDHRVQRGWDRRGYDDHRWDGRNDGWRRAAERRDWERRRHDLERHRAAAMWRFERGHGWRFERRPGIWSPAFVWWWVDGRPILRPFPTARIVRYNTGYYELLGDGISVPYYWAWRPTIVAAPVRPPVPLPPPPPAEYPFPTEGGYPPPPPPPPMG